MERSRVYLFSRLTHLIRVVEFLYEEGNELSEIEKLDPSWKRSTEGVAAHLARRSVYLPTQVDGTYQEIIRLVASLQELNRVAISLTGSLSDTSPKLPVKRPKTPLVAPLVDYATNRPFANAADVVPTRVRPVVSHSRSQVDLRVNTDHPAHRGNPEVQGKFIYLNQAPR